MKTLKTIIRVRTWELEERRRRLAELQGFKDQVEAAIVDLDTRVRDEQAFVSASGDVAIARAYGAFAEAAVDRRRSLVETSADADRQIDMAMAEVIEAYQELKKYEIALEERKQQELLERNRREQIQLDEMAIEGFRRKQ